MKKFKFKLEKVLDHRKNAETERKNALSAAERLRRENEQSLADLRETETGWQERLRDLQSDDMDVRDVMLCYSHLDALKRRIAQQQHKVRGLRVQVDMEREKLLSARRETEVLEKLKGRVYRNYLHRVNRVEQKNDDEVGLNLFNRREGEHGN